MHLTKARLTALVNLKKAVLLSLAEQVSQRRYLFGSFVNKSKGELVAYLFFHPGLKMGRIIGKAKWYHGG